MLFYNDKETLASVEAPVQLVSGAPAKVIFNPEQLRRALTSCGKAATVSLGLETWPALFEAEGYWHVLAPLAGEFPSDMVLTQAEREALDLAIETIQEVRRGTVFARVEVGGGRFVIELDPKREKTEIVVSGGVHVQ